MKKRKRIYISGPISGLKRERYLRLFADAESSLKTAGYEVVNPTKLAPCRWRWIYAVLGYRWTLAYDIWHLKRCDGIFMIPGWMRSRGARVEYRKAKKKGLKVLRYI